jgi:hypothetical protein
MERVQYVRRCQARHTSAAALPASIEKDSALARKTGQHVSAIEMGPDHRVWHGGIGNSKVRNLVLAQYREMFGSQSALQCIRTYDVCFG